jgi:hypothetical protein
MGDLVEHAKSSKFLHGALRIDSTVEHPHEVVRRWQNELNMMRYQDLG